MADNAEAPGDLIDKHIDSLALDDQCPASIAAVEAAITLQKRFAQSSLRRAPNDRPIADDSGDQPIANR